MMSACTARWQIALWLLGAHALFFLLTVSMPRVRLVELLCLVGLSVSVGVVRAFWPVIGHALFHRKKLDETDVMAFAAFCKSAALTILTSWIIGHRFWYGDTPRLRDSLMLVYVLFLACVGGFFYMASEGAIKGNIPRPAWIRSGIVVAIGVLLFGIAVTWII